MALILVAVGQRRKDRKFHIFHPQAECLEASEIGGERRARAIPVLLDPSDPFELIFARNPSSYIAREDVCQHCLRNLTAWPKRGIPIRPDERAERSAQGHA